MSRLRPVAAVLTVLLAVCAAAGVASAQFFGSYREGNFPPVYAPDRMPDGDFVACRLEYTRVRSEPSGIGWQTDYPYGEINFMTRVSELTKVRVSRGDGHQPRHYVVRATDDTLFNCPFILASDAGTIGFSEPEIVRLREYFLKGGFLWVDDFWGDAAWNHWEWQIGRVLPRSEFPIEDIPMSDPILRSLFEIQEVPQITNIQFWRRWGGLVTSERGEETEIVNFRAIRDAHGRVMVVMTHNTDVADSWEREGEDPEFFYQFSPAGYALGVNVLLHVLTH
jgi:hypothetical protein